MWELTGALTVLGVPAGALIAWRVPDETGWYPDWFLGVGGTLAVLAGLFAGWQQGALYAWMGFALAGVLLFGASSVKPQMMAVPAALIAGIGGMLTWQLLAVSLMLLTGYLWNRGARKSLWWFALTPIVIILLFSLA